jgi:TolB-like protein
MAEPPRIRSTTPVGKHPIPNRRREVRSLFASALLMVLMSVIALVYTHPWTARPALRVAVARFDNETAYKDYDRFADGLGDAVAESLRDAASGRYRVISSGAILRVPRQRRDLAAIGSSLGVSYVVTGQVERSPLGIRVLANLIRLPDQTNIRVASLERKVGDKKKAQAEIAASIADQFVPRLSLLGIQTTPRP